MKKFISFALAASMALSMVPATAFAASDLRTSHSNIRVTADTEFYPAGETDPSVTHREVPYIQLEATSNFNYDKQEFELVLENAEWLETIDDGDKLYIETDTYMKGKDGIKLTTADSSTSGGGTTDGTVTQLEDAYKAEISNVKKAYDAYKAAVSPEYANAVKAVEEAKKALAEKETAQETAKTEWDKAQTLADNAVSTVSAVNALLDDATNGVASTSYQDALETVYGTETANLASVSTLGGTSTNTSLVYESGTATKQEIAFEDFSNTGELGGAYVSGDEFVNWELSAQGMASASNGFTGATQNYSTATISAAASDDFSGTQLQVSAATLGTLYTTKAANFQKTATATAAEEAYKSAVELLEGVHTKLTDLGAFDTAGNIINADDLISAAAAAEEAYNSAVAEVSAAQSALDSANAALSGMTPGTAAEEAKAALDSAVAAADAAGVAYMKKLIDVSAMTVTDAAGRVEKIDTELYTGDYVQFAKDTAGWEAAYKGSGTAVADAYTGVDGTTLNVTITKKSDTRIVVTTEGYKFKDGDVLQIPLFVRTTGGVASVSIDSLDSEFTSEGKTFAQTADGDTELSIEKVQNFYDDDEIKNLFLEELVPGTLEPGKYISLRMGGDFKFKAGNDGVTVTRITGVDGELSKTLKVEQKDGNNGYKAFNPKDEADEIYIKIPDGDKASTRAVQYRIEGLRIVEDGADFGDEATVTVSGAGTTKQTITIGTYEDYGVKMTAEDKDLPVIYAGTKASSRNDNQTLKVTIEETVANSFIDNRKMEITLPDGVEFAYDGSDSPQVKNDIDDFVEDFKVYNFAKGASDVKAAMSVNDNGDKITINGKDLPEAAGTNKDKKRKIEFSVHVSADAAFTGDVVMTLSGAGVGNQEISATVATVKAPIEVKTDVNELIIDYRNTNIADITLVEPEAGLWAKDDIITLEGEKMDFEDGAKAEVVNGDMSLAKLDGDNIEVDGGLLKIQVDSRSSKTPAEIKISGLSLYMDRSLAAGDYKLKVMGDTKNEFFMNNYNKDGDDYNNFFETEKVTVMTDFVKIVTAGRDQDDSTFTTKITVPVGSDVIYAGTKEIKLSEMEGGACPPAYINADGYTMLPVRAVVEALNGIAVVRWDDATKTCTISFGSRIFSMTVGSKVLNMNGVGTALNAAPENKDGRVFLPLRDLGYALGLSDNQIAWDATTNTATLN